ncbi:hypothetical protein MK280_19590 [Myxococcota bacterium]|nr:hypothetical protein [Myxococcota bacterium]
MSEASRNYEPVYPAALTTGLDNPRRTSPRSQTSVDRNRRVQLSASRRFADITGRTVFLSGKKTQAYGTHLVSKRASRKPIRWKRIVIAVVPIMLVAGIAIPSFFSLHI